jgi:hypothetical protein
MTNDSERFLSILAQYDSSFSRAPRFPSQTQHNEASAVPTIATDAIEHTTFLEAGTRIARAHRRFQQSGASDGVLITGQSGVGKSSLVKWYVRHFPPQETAERTIIPVLRVRTPTAPTVPKMTRAILEALGDAAPGRGKEEEQLARMHQFLRDSKVEIILIEEFQQFIDHRSVATYGITDWIKNQHDESGVPFVLLGLPRAANIISQNPQLCRRFGCRFYMQPFNGDTEAGWREFRGILRELRKRMPGSGPQLHHPDLARRILFASEGLIDYIVRVLNEALAIAHRRQCLVDVALLGEAYRETVWRGVPDDLNPFLTNGALRTLRGPGQPFELWDETKL